MIKQMTIDGLCFNAKYGYVYNAEEEKYIPLP